MEVPISIRLATGQEKPVLEAMFNRASLANEADRAFLLTHPEMFDIPLGVSPKCFKLPTQIRRHCGNI